MPTDIEFEDQDQSELFDEDRINPDDGASGPDMLTFEELPDEYDVTTALGDAEDNVARDADELGEEDLQAIGEDDDALYDEDGEDDTLDDDFEDEPNENVLFDSEDLDEVDGVDEAEPDEAAIEYVGDTDTAMDARGSRARVYESSGELSNEDLQELGYQSEEKP